MPLQGITENTEKVFDVIKHYKELKSYYLVGGTGLSIRLGHRLSEDLDLFFFNQYPGSKQKLPQLNKILDKFKGDFEDFKIIDGDDFDVKALINGVKVDLHSENQFKRSPYDNIEYLRHPTTESLLGMKIVALSLRDAWRDVYDLFFLKKTYPPKDFYNSFCSIVPSKYCGNKTNRKILFLKLMDKLGDKKKLKKLFQDDNLTQLKPKEDVSPKSVIESFKYFRHDLDNEINGLKYGQS